MKLIRVDMKDKTVRSEAFPEYYLGKAGRGLTSAIINREVSAQCDPLSADNKLVIATGLLSGTSMVNAGRLSVGAKSPLTGGIKESNAGGRAACYLGRLEIGAIIVEGRASDSNLWMLHIKSDGSGTLEAAQEYRGMRTYRLAERLLERYGDKASVLCIGPAGEYKMPIASIQTTDLDGHPCRAAGRGGLGAVFGAKGLKAIIIEPLKGGIGVVSDPKSFKGAVKDFAAVIKKIPFSGKVLPKLGTAALVAVVNQMGAFPCRNATIGKMEGWENISGNRLAGLIQQRGGQSTHKGCLQCIIDCSNRYVDPQGRYLTGSLEYETIWSMGGMTGINDLDTIAKLDFLCDDIGLDTMSAGVAISVAMDAGYREFGDGQSALSMLEEIAEGTDLGMVLGNGPNAVGEHFGHHRIPTVKKQSIAGYDPRAMQGMAVTYATSPMGADHTAGNLIGLYSAGRMDPLKKEGQIEASRTAQITVASLDCTGLCLFTLAAVTDPVGQKALFKAISAQLGREFGHEEFMAQGCEVLRIEQEFNKKAGFTRKDDHLPPFFYSESLPPHNQVVLIGDKEMEEVLRF